MDSNILKDAIEEIQKYVSREQENLESAEDRFIPIAEPELGGNEIKYILDAYLSTWVSSVGKYVTEFENKFSKYCGCSYGVTTSNGTTALHLALVALGVGKGDEVIVPDITFASTINAVLYTGATPVIVDIENDSWCIDPDEIEKAITDRTKAIIPVHIYGQPCDMERIMEIAEKYNLYVIEDCAEAHGAKYNGKMVGSFGDIGCYSFFGNKIITTGEGGMCITNDSKLDYKMRVLRDHGMNKKNKYYHDCVGFNYRITNIQAALGLGQLETIDDKLEWRKKLEDRYRNEIKDIAGVYLQNSDLHNREKVAWLIVAYFDDAKKRDILMEKMKAHNIDARPYFVPLSQMEIYKDYVFSNKNSMYISQRGFNLPVSSRIGDVEIKRIVSVLKEVAQEG